MNIADLRDAYMGARAEIEGVVEEVMEEVTRPDKLLEIAIRSSLMSADEWNSMPPEVRAQIEEVLNG